MPDFPTQSLLSLLSKQASISLDPTSSKRWSQYQEPQGRAVVTVAFEADVAATVRFLSDGDIPFLVQVGGHGWSWGFDFPAEGVIINLRALNYITFNANKTEATIGGGIISEEVVNASWENGTEVLMPNCLQVGVIGAALGGGYGDLTGEHGFGIDQFISMNVVLHDGTSRTITTDDEDLWWAMRGAGHNFGIVTSAVVKAYPTPRDQSQAYFGPLFFEDHKLEGLVEALNTVELRPNMNVFLYYIASDSGPCVMSTIFFRGSEEDAKKAFAPLWALEPWKDDTGMLPFNKWNAGTEPLNGKGGRKPGYGAGMMSLGATACRAIWEDYKKLLATDPDFQTSLDICEAYSLERAQALEPNGPGTTASFPGRHLRWNVAAVPWRTKTSLDGQAEAFGSRARELWRASSGLPAPTTYVNFAAGDESNEIVYGDSIERLRRLKARYDPKNVFRYWFNIKVA